MSGRLLFLLCSVPMLALAACSSETPADPQDAAQPGADARASGADASNVENTLAACQDQEDNDGDGHTDCADQDCWIYVACAQPDASASGPDAGSPAPDAGPGRDAAAPGDSGQVGPDAGPVAGPDAGSPTISASRFTFGCQPSSLVGFSQFGGETQCKVTAADVAGDFVPGTVLFLAEAGGLPRSASLTNGEATVTYRSQCPYPRDVASSGSSDPGTACQFHNYCLATPAEESRTCNPRDTWAMLVAMTEGSESFVDQNGTQTWEPGEMFTDLPEPFVDANDSGTRDADEDFFDVNNNGKWDGPNGKWDAHTTIWTTTKVIWTGAPY